MSIIFIPIFMFFIILVLFLSMPYWVFLILTVIAISTGRIFLALILALISYSKYKSKDRINFKYYRNEDFNNFHNFENFENFGNYSTNSNIFVDEYEEACKYFGFSKETPYSEKKSIYKKLVRQYHPDLNKAKDAEEKIKEINKNWDIIEKNNN